MISDCINSALGLITCQTTNLGNKLCLEARAGRTAQGLAVEKVFLTKCRDDKGIRAPTFEQEKARRCRRGGGRQVAVAPVMDVAAVHGRFDE